MVRAGEKPNKPGFPSFHSPALELLCDICFGLSQDGVFPETSDVSGLSSKYILKNQLDAFCCGMDLLTSGPPCRAGLLSLKQLLKLPGGLFAHQVMVDLTPEFFYSVRLAWAREFTFLTNFPGVLLLLAWRYILRAKAVG